MTSDAHRPDVQGLRALAVGLVVVFHFFPSLLPGGFMGVDVFFVISGYLITGLLLRELRRTGRVELSAFYARRIRRLLPASTLVLVCTALAHVVLPAVEWEGLVLDVASSGLWVQNFNLAWGGVDYFSVEGQVSPLLHYWSLSIEEQFYLVFPPLLVLVSGRKAAAHRAFAILVVITVASLTWSISSSTTGTSGNYYLPWARAWEFGAGGILCWLPDLEMSSRKATVIRGMGLTLVLSGVLGFQSGIEYPGWFALLPCGGTALLLLPRQDEEPLGRILGSRMLVWIGDRSYSLYLWHWPVLVVALSLHSEPLPIATKVLLLALSAVLSDLTKRVVEDPVRSGARSKAFAWRILAASLVLTGLLSVGLLARIRAEMMRPADDSGHNLTLLAIRARSDFPEPYQRGCYANLDETRALTCQYGDQGAKHHLVLFGDSHAAQWAPALIQAISNRSMKLTTVLKMECPPGQTPAYSWLKGYVPYPSCETWREAALEYIEEARPDMVLLSQSRAYVPTHPLPEGERRERRRIESLVDGLDKTIKRLSRTGAVVTVIADTPKLKIDVPSCLARSTGDNCDTDLSQLKQPGDAILSLRRDTKDVLFLDPTPKICPRGVCPALSAGRVVWRDQHHLTASAAEQYADLFDEALGQVEQN